MEIKREVLGPKAPGTATAINNLGFVYDKMGDRATARKMYEEALAIRKEVLGMKHAETRMSLNNVGGLLLELQEYAAARPYLEQALVIAKTEHGMMHPDTGNALAQLGGLAAAEGDDQRALPLFQQALSIYKAVYGDNHPKTATVLSSMGVAQYHLADYVAAKKNLEQTLGIYDKAFGPRSAEAAKTHALLGRLHTDQGDFAAAKTHYELALAIRQEKFAADSDEVGSSLNDMGSLQSALGNDASAKSYYDQALALSRRLHGDNHLSTAAALLNVGYLNVELGDLATAKAQLEEALTIYTNVVGNNHPNTARAIISLGQWYRLTGDFVKAKGNFEKAIDICTKQLGPKHSQTAVAIGALGLLLTEHGHRTGEYGDAERHLRKAVEIDMETQGPKHPVTLTALNNLGLYYLGIKRYDQAQQTLEQALTAAKEMHGANNVKVTNLMGNLGGVFYDQRKYDKAQTYYEQSLKILRDNYGPQNINLANNITHLMSLKGRQHKWKEAGDHMTEARQIVRAHVTSVLPLLGPSEQLQFLAIKDVDPWHGALSLGLHQKEHPPLATLSAEFLTNGKAIIQESLAEQAVLALGAKDAKTQQLVQELIKARTQLATLSQLTPKPNELAKYRQQLGELEKLERKLAAQVNTALGRSAQTGNWITQDQVRQGIPKGALLIDIARFDTFDYDAKPNERDFTPAHYIAWLTPAIGEGDIQVIDLGEAQPIDDAVLGYQTALQPCQSSDQSKNPLTKLGEAAAEKQMRDALAKITTLVLKPLLPHFKDTQELILSPDAALWLVPWAALPIGDQYAIERWKLRYVISARDLAGGTRVGSKNAPRIFANPNYNLAAADIPDALVGVLGGTASKPTLAEGNLLASNELRGRQANGLGKVPLLPGTAVEAAAITPNVKTFSGAEPKVYTERSALEGVFKRLQSPRVLVVSTHGFFLADQQTNSQEREVAGTSNDRKIRQAALDQTGHVIENPLLRCGLLLAGCNNRDKITSDSKLDDGMLTGMEIVGTDLRGTELVVLSACETGLGDVNDGQGVAGLRQAFQLAGAQSVVATLWQIPDQATAQLMNDLFANLADGQSKAEALRNAQLARIKARREKFGAAHPLFWAAFTITGAN